MRKYALLLYVNTVSNFEKTIAVASKYVVVVIFPRLLGELQTTVKIDLVIYAKV